MRIKQPCGYSSMLLVVIRQLLLWQNICYYVSAGEFLLLLQLLWTKDLHMNTVHVSDMCKALWHLRDLGNNGDIYNIVDNGDSSEWHNIVVC